MVGLALSRRFFAAVVEPLLERAAPQLRYSAGRLGDGSEVLGFDTEMSADHNFGPTVQVFLDVRDFSRAEAIMAELDANLPEQFEGWPVRYPCAGRPHRAEGWLTSGHGVEIITLEALLVRQIGIDHDMLDHVDWLGAPEQRLLTLTAGAVFRDDSGALLTMRERLRYFPQDVWLAKLAAQWDRIGEERAFVGRTGDLGDDLGSRLIASRLVQDLMRVGFLNERRYAPYAKWFGTAFQRLDCAPRLDPLLRGAMTAQTWQDRELHIARAAEILGRLQVDRGVPGAVAPRIDRYFTRPFQVVNADEIAAGLRGAISDAKLRSLPAGAVDQFADATPILSRPKLARALATSAMS